MNSGQFIPGLDIPMMHREMFASMGSFSEAFGMDRLNFGTLIGFYAVECGNVLGLGGAFFASLCAVGILSKEEKDKTAEFLLIHPVSRKRIVTEKLIAVFVQITAMNIIVYAAASASVAAVGEPVPWKEISLLHLVYCLLQWELAGICFGISAFLRRGSAGAGLGVAVMMYFLNIIANIADSAEFLKYITPFGYCDGADIVSNGSLDHGRRRRSHGNRRNNRCLPEIYEEGYTVNLPRIAAASAFLF
ncbi:MAG: ABC transporter permease subunit [Eubacteriales bacterium]